MNRENEGKEIQKLKQYFIEDRRPLMVGEIKFVTESDPAGTSGTQYYVSSCQPNAAVIITDETKIFVVVTSSTLTKDPHENVIHM